MPYPYFKIIGTVFEIQFHVNQRSVSFSKTKKKKKKKFNFKVIEMIQRGSSITYWRCTYIFTNLKIYVYLQYERIQSQGEGLMNLIL